MITLDFKDLAMRYLFILTVLLGMQNQSEAQKILSTNNTNTIEGITDRMLELISGDIGEERNWDAFRNLFLPSAQMLSTGVSSDGRAEVNSMSIEEFVTNIGPYYSRDGFEEYSIGLTVNEFNGIANVFQSFYCKNLKGTYEKRGINSYQLVFKDGRWWVANVLFTNETPSNPLPDKYLSNNRDQNTTSNQSSNRSQTKERPILNIKKRQQ